MTALFILSASEIPPQFAIMLVAMIFAFGALIYKSLQMQKREDEFRDWVKKKGLRFRWEDPPSIKERYPHFRCLWKGDSQSVDRFANGVLDGRAVCAFDYRYTVHAGKNTVAQSFSAVIVELDVPLIPLVIYPETMKTRLTDWLSNGDIDFESLDFNRRFFVRAEDRLWAYNVLHQGMMDFLMSSPDFSIEFGGKSIIAYREESFPIPDFDNALQLLEGIVRRLPAYLLAETKGTA